MEQDHNNVWWKILEYGGVVITTIAASMVAVGRRYMKDRRRLSALEHSWKHAEKRMDTLATSIEDLIERQESLQRENSADHTDLKVDMAEIKRDIRWLCGRQQPPPPHYDPDMGS